MSAYEIDGIAQSSDMTATGARIDVMRVTFVTPEGDNGQVTVPLAAGWEEKAKQLITEQVAAYAALRSGSTPVA